MNPLNYYPGNQNVQVPNYQYGTPYGVFPNVELDGGKRGAFIRDYVRQRVENSQFYDAHYLTEAQELWDASIKIAAPK